MFTPGGGEDVPERVGSLDGTGSSLVGVEPRDWRTDDWTGSGAGCSIVSTALGLDAVVIGDGIEFMDRVANDEEALPSSAGPPAFVDLPKMRFLTFETRPSFLRSDIVKSIQAKWASGLRYPFSYS
jgi:hypothetical protein